MSIVFEGFCLVRDIIVFIRKHRHHLMHSFWDIYLGLHSTCFIFHNALCLLLAHVVYDNNFVASEVSSRHTVIVAIVTCGSFNRWNF